MADDSNSSINDYDLECYSSSFEYGDELNSDEDSSSDQQFGIRPYMFEPEASNSENESTTVADDINEKPRVGNKEWCQCGHCEEMSTEKESRCCKEIQKVMSRIQEYESEFDKELKCVTEHPGFEPLCLNRTVLDVAYLNYRQHYDVEIEENILEQHYDVEIEENILEQRRFTARRQLARWCWEYVGRDVRVTLPSCAVVLIRKHFPLDSS